MADRATVTIRPARWLAAGVLVLAFCLSGCSPWRGWNPRGEGFSGDTAELGQGLRPLDDNREAWAISTKGQQVEQHLGVGRRTNR